MRILLCTILSSAFILSGCYTASETLVTVKGKEKENRNFSYRQYGFINGVRLDSLPARYGEYFSAYGELCFYYGQPRKGEGYLNLQILTSDGKPIRFYENRHIEILNFFAFNRWELSQIYLPSVGREVKRTTAEYLLIKKD